MNYVDIGILLVIAMGVIIGMYYGFTVSLLGIASFFASWLGAFIFYPALSRGLISNYPDLLNKIIYYTDGATKTGLTNRTIAVSSLTKDQIKVIIGNSELPSMFNRHIETNLIKQRLGGLQSLGQYFDYTVANIILNLISFIILFFIIRLTFSLLISIAKNLKGIPVLKQFDTIMGGALGIINGILIILLLFAFLPLLSTVVPEEIFAKYLDGSTLAQFFLKANLFTSFIRGII